MFRRYAQVGGLFIALLTISSCGGGSSPRHVDATPRTSGASDAPAATAVGHYTGNGTNIPSLTFDVSGDGVSNITGHVLVACASMSASSMQVFSYSDPEQLSVKADGTFATTYAIPSTGTVHGTLSVTGRLDSRGGARGTLSYTQPGCGVAPSPWTAALAGATPPTPPTTGAATTAPCSPSPCLSVGNITMRVQDTALATDANRGTTLVNVKVSLDNNGDSAVTFGPDGVHLGVGTAAPIWPGRLLSVARRDGSTFQCSDLGVSVPASGSATVDLCYAPLSDPTGAPLRLSWTWPGFGTSSVDIGTAS